MKKTNIITASLFGICSISPLYIYAGPPRPPVQLVKSATIEVVQGDSIYANGAMQSQLRVMFDLQTDANVLSVRLKEFGSERYLEDIGWQVSTKDNGFDHNLASVRSFSALRFQPAQGDKFIDLFVSTDKANQKLKACFEIVAERNGTNSYFNTCEKYDVDRGTVSLSALMPPAYSAEDFTLEDVETYHLYERNTHALHQSFSVVGKVYVVKPESGLGINTRFKTEQTYPADTLFAWDPEQAGPTKYQDPRSSEFPHFWSATAYLFDSTKADTEGLTFYVMKSPFSTDERITDVSLQGYYGESAIFGFVSNAINFRNFLVHQKNMFNQPYLARCTNKEGLYCVQDMGFRIGPLKPETVVNYIEPSKKIFLIDNYGTRFSLLLSYSDDGTPKLS